MRKRKQKGLRVSDFAFSLCISKLHHDSERVNKLYTLLPEEREKKVKDKSRMRPAQV